MCERYDTTREFFVRCSFRLTYTTLFESKNRKKIKKALSRKSEKTKKRRFLDKKKRIIRGPLYKGRAENRPEHTQADRQTDTHTHTPRSRQRARELFFRVCVRRARVFSSFVLKTRKTFRALCVFFFSLFSLSFVCILEKKRHFSQFPQTSRFFSSFSLSLSLSYARARKERKKTTRAREREVREFLFVERVFLVCVCVLCVCLCEERERNPPKRSPPFIRDGRST